MSWFKPTLLAEIENRKEERGKRIKGVA